MSATLPPPGPARPGERALRFGPVEIRASDRKVRIGPQEHQPGSRAFDLLLYLAEHADRIVTKDELLCNVWSGLVVQENNLTVQVSALRKLLGADAVVTVPGRGYRFTLERTGPADSIPAAEGSAWPLPANPSVVVLPLLDLSADGSQAHLADGFTEDVTTELSRFNRLFVIARNSAFSYKGRAVDVRHVARELGVRYVVEGSVRRAGESLRVTVQLVDATTGAHVWAEKYDAPAQDVFVIQDAVVRSIAQAVAQGVEMHEIGAARRRPASGHAQEIAMLARHHAMEGWTIPSTEHREQAIQLARRALQIDPSNPLALTVLADASWQHLFFFTAADPAEREREGLQAAERLISIDRDDHVGHKWHGLLLGHLERWPEALASLRKGRVRNPNDAQLLNALAFVEIYVGLHHDGIEHALAGLRINPRDPAAWQQYAVLAMGHVCAADYERAIAYAERCLADAPKVVTGHLNKALGHAGLGQMDQAAAAMREARAVNPRFIESRLGGRVPFQSPEVAARWLALARAADEAARHLTLPGRTA